MDVPNPQFKRSAQVSLETGLQTQTYLADHYPTQTSPFFCFMSKIFRGKHTDIRQDRLNPILVEAVCAFKIR